MNDDVKADNDEPKMKVLVDMLGKIKESETETFNFAVPNLISRKLASYMLIREDILYIKNLIDKLIYFRTTPKENLIEEIDHYLTSSLWYTTIIIYGKCFTHNKGRMSSLVMSDCFNGAMSDLKEAHDELMYLRNSYIAHRDDTENEQTVVYLKIPKNEDIGAESEYTIKTVKAISPSGEKMATYLKLFSHLLNVVETKIKESSQKVHSDFIKSFTPEQMVLLLVNNITK